jgi:hypothetical protein
MQEGRLDTVFSEHTRCEIEGESLGDPAEVEGHARSARCHGGEILVEVEVAHPPASGRVERAVRGKADIPCQPEQIEGVSVDRNSVALLGMTEKADETRGGVAIEPLMAPADLLDGAFSHTTEPTGVCLISEDQFEPGAHGLVGESDQSLFTFLVVGS